MCGAFQLNDTRAICSMAGVTWLVSLALFLGYDGVLLMSGIAIISGLGGYILMKEGHAMLPDLAQAIELFDRRRR